jgi:hypothetical protein
MIREAAVGLVQAVAARSATAGGRVGDLRSKAGPTHRFILEPGQHRIPVRLFFQFNSAVVVEESPEVGQRRIVSGTSIDFVAPKYWANNLRGGCNAQEGF